MDKDGGVSKLEGLRTEVASRAALLVAVVAANFKGYEVGAGVYAFEVKAPEGQSTAGGKQARQNMRLVPRREGHSVIVVGTLDPANMVAEIRTFDHVAQVHEERFRRPFDLTPEEYGGFVAKLESELRATNIQTRPLPPPATTPAKKSGGGTLAGVAVGVVLVLALLAFAALRFLR